MQIFLVKLNLLILAKVLRNVLHPGRIYWQIISLHLVRIWNFLPTWQSTVKVSAPTEAKDIGAQKWKDHVVRYFINNKTSFHGYQKYSFQGLS